MTVIRIDITTVKFSRFLLLYSIRLNLLNGIGLIVNVDDFQIYLISVRQYKFQSEQPV